MKKTDSAHKPGIISRQNSAHCSNTCKIILEICKQDYTLFDIIFGILCSITADKICTMHQKHGITPHDINHQRYIIYHFISYEDAAGPDDGCLIYFYFDICRLSLAITSCLVVKCKINWRWYNQKQCEANVFLFLKAPVQWVDMTTTVKVRKPAHLLLHLPSPAFICGSTKHFINTAVSGGASPLAPLSWKWSWLLPSSMFSWDVGELISTLGMNKQ